MTESVSESSATILSNSTMKKNMKILHVDDDPSFLKVTKQSLEMQGIFAVDTASSVNEALEKLEKTDYDAIVSDYQMPGKDGLEFLSELREKGNNTPFIVFTGKGREEISVKALNLGASGYFNKHGEPETVYGELAHGVRMAVERKWAEEEVRKASEEWRRTFDAISDFLFVLDKDQRFVRVNKAVCDFLKKEPKKLIGKHCYEVLHGTDEPLPNCPCREMSLTRKAVTTEVDDLNSGLSFLMTVSPFLDDKGEHIGCVHVAKDITRRRRSERELFDERMKLQNIFAASPDAIVVIDLSGNIIECNEGALKMLRYSSKEEVMGKNAIIFLATKEQQRATHGLENTMKDGLTKDVEYTAVSKDGHELPIELSVSVVRDVSGNPVGFVAIIRDIIERKKAEGALRESEEKFRTIVESIQDVVMLTLPNGIISYLSPACSQVLGYQPEELVGKQPWIFHPDDLGKVKAAHFDALKGKKGSDFEYRIITKKGQTRWISHSWSPIITNGQVKLIASAVVDITERKKMDEELKSSEQKFRGLVEDSAVAIATTDLKGRLTYVNKALADSLGYSVQEMSGRAFKDFLHPDDKGRLVRLFLKIIVLRRQPRKFEFRALRKDGAILHLMCKPTRLETAGKTTGFQTIIIDNTAEKRMLEKVEKMNEKLSVVGGLTRHDVNNKLSTILNVSYLLKQRLHDNQSLELVKETESAVHQIEGLFEFARTYEKLGTEELTYVDAEKVFNEAVMFFPSLQDIRIVNECHGLTVLADSLLRQLFYNLVDNSLKHGEKPSRIRVFYEEKNDHLNVIYEDDGVGIPRAAKPKLFDEGYTTGKGSSHGLYLVKRMMEVYGWTIQEVGTPGKGAKFAITISKTNQNGKENYRLH